MKRTIKIFIAMSMAIIMILTLCACGYSFGGSKPQRKIESFKTFGDIIAAEKYPFYFVSPDGTIACEFDYAGTTYHAKIKFPAFMYGIVRNVPQVALSFLPITELVNLTKAQKEFNDEYVGKPSQSLLDDGYEIYWVNRKDCEFTKNPWKLTVTFKDTKNLSDLSDDEIASLIIDGIEADYVNVIDLT
jgi:hypothetical protein